MKSVEEIQNNLPYFTGTEHYYQYNFGIKLTDGVKYLADSCDCYWLLDIVASYQVDEKIKNEEFQVYKLNVKDNSAVLEITDGNYNILATQEIEYTDFPLDEITIWFTDDVILLPSEY